MDDSIFAEIEIEPKQPNHNATGGTALRFFVPSSPPQAIKPRVTDPIREKFYEMRKLASERPFARSDSELFYRQARFMEDFEDNYEGNANFNMYYPYYQNMGYEYLRTYFTWRTKVRQGDIQPASLSYIYLYIYELLSGIGTTDPEDGFEKLLTLWNNVPFIKPGVEKYLSKWFKDYYVFYLTRDAGMKGDDSPTYPFSEFIEKHELQKYFSLTLLFNENTDNKLEIWNSVSGYDITNSRYYKDGNEQVLTECFNAVLNEIREFCKKRSTRLEDLLIYSVGRKAPWQPFKQALFGSRVRQNDREIKISEFERYQCKNGQWTASLPIYYSSQRDFVGYIIKKTEACLRAETKYKYKLVAEMKPGSKPFRELQRPAAKRAELDKTIEKAVMDFYKSIHRIAVKVDHSNLARIREEAYETQEQLIVIEPDESTKTPQDTPQDTPITLSFADGWKALKNILTDTERQALFLALQENADIKAFANEKGIMLEVLVDGINEKAADCIGDNLLEIDDEIILYDEYRENIVSIVCNLTT